MKVSYTVSTTHNLDLDKIDLLVFEMCYNRKCEQYVNFIKYLCLRYDLELKSAKDIWDYLVQTNDPY